MKKYIYLSFLFSLFSLNLAFGQIVINEIMYNPPEGGSDSLEYIELYNNSALTVDLTDWTMGGVTYTFPNGTMLNAGEYLLLTVNASAFENVYGISGTLEWTSGGLSNGGETVQLFNGNGTLVDIVDYSDSGSWVTEPDSFGPSLELCSPDRDNSLAENWFAATTATGFFIDGVELKGTPGAANTGTCPPDFDHTVTVQNFSFVPADITINLGETIQFQCISGTHNVNGSTATYPGNPAGFSNGPAAPAPWNFNHTFDVEGVYDYRCDPHFGSGMVGTVTVVTPTVADIVITELMYNTPGTDDLEFIELYNNGSETVDMTGYSFSDGVTFTFPDNYELAAGAYAVVALNADAMLSNFGTTALQWDGGNLGNGGELVRLVDNDGNEVDAVDYGDDAPWTEIADGNGPSLSLCDVNADNSMAGNWGASTTATGVTYGFLLAEIYASPGLPNASCSTVAHVLFNGTAETVGEGDGSENIGLILGAVGTNLESTITVMPMGTSTATEGVDYTLGSNELTLTATADGERVQGDIVFNIINDTEEEGDETVVLMITEVTNGALIQSSTLTVTITDDDGLSYPEYTISEVTTSDADGVPDSTGVLCQLQGIVHGVDLNGGGSIQFTVIDATGGIGLFSSNDFGYTVTEGDEVIIRGSIEQFNGLIQIAPDTLWMTSANNMLTTSGGSYCSGRRYRIRNDSY